MGDGWLDGVFNTVTESKNYVNSILPAGMSVRSIFKNVATGAKDKFIASTGQALANDPRTKAAVKEGIGNKLGNWLMDNWYVPVGIIAITILIVIFYRGRR